VSLVCSPCRRTCICFLDLFACYTNGKHGVVISIGPFSFVDLQPDRVMDFCKNNDLQLIIRAHECVMDGFERFAQGHLITLFSATNYCGTANNAGAILVLGRDLVVVPKLIHPIPPAFTSPESSPEHHLEDTWMQVPIFDG
jgi:hypothetical protein